MVHAVSTNNEIAGGVEAVVVLPIHHCFKLLLCSKPRSKCPQRLLSTSTFAPLLPESRRHSQPENSAKHDPSPTFY